MSRDLGFTSAGDLAIVDGDLVIDTETTVIISNARIRLLTILAEWFFDYTVGVDWIDGMFSTSTSYDQKVAISKSAILEDPEILSISDFEFAMDPVNHSAEISFTATTIYSPIQVEVFV
jgi:hypothetical protein